MKIERKILDKWADILLSHCLRGVRDGDVVMIKGEAVSWPLISALQEKVIKCGASADVFIVAPDNERGRVWSSTAARLSSTAKLRTIPAWQKARYETATKYVEIYGMESPELVRNPNSPGMRQAICCEGEIRKIWTAKLYAITLFPTPAFAKIEGMPFARYQRLVCAASTQPVAPMRRVAASLSAALRKTAEIRIRTRRPDSGEKYELRMSIKNSLISDDTVSGGNIPCGEVCTSPDANSVSGEIFLDMPISKQGAVMRGIYLKFVSGQLVSLSAERGLSALREIVRTDAGASRLGEVAFGINPGLGAALMHPLFCEKLAGTMHIALGCCFAGALVKNPGSADGSRKFKSLVKSGAANISAQHVDLVVSFRKGGAGQSVFIDGKELKLSNGNWKVAA